MLDFLRWYRRNWQLLDTAVLFLLIVALAGSLLVRSFGSVKAEMRGAFSAVLEMNDDLSR